MKIHISTYKYYFYAKFTNYRTKRINHKVNINIIFMLDSQIIERIRHKFDLLF